MAKQLPAFALLLWVLPALLQASSPRDPYQFFFEQSLGDLTEELEISRQNRVRATPMMAFYDLQGKQVFKYTGAGSKQNAGRNGESAGTV